MFWMTFCEIGNQTFSNFSLMSNAWSQELDYCQNYDDDENVRKP